jgi:tRNA (guanine37-N1)-methyltransferase
MRIDLITLFPTLFEAPLHSGVVGKAIETGIATVGLIDPRAYTRDAHRTVDDAPYGGGGGMVMKPEPLAQAIREAKSRGPGPVVLMSPQGRRLSQRDLSRWAALDHLVLVCGRYEGFDERVRGLCDEQISLGDFVLTGGEYAALAIADGVIRLLPGTLGNESSPVTDSFVAGLLEHPHYTRPQVFEGSEVPEVLRSGDHAKVEEWRRRESLRRTLSRRPDLFVERGATEEERFELVAFERPKPEVTLIAGFARAPEPARITDLARLAAAYRIEVRLIGELGEIEGALAAAPSVELPKPLPAKEKKKLKRRPLPTITIDPRAICRPFDAREDLGLLVAVATDADAPIAGPEALRTTGRRLALLVGPTGLVPAVRLPPFRVASEAQDLPMLAAAAVALDRLLGEGG